MPTKLSLRLAILSFAAAATLTGAAYNVSSEPQSKDVLFEEFTGVQCTNCPEGAQLIERLISENPGKIHSISIHEGYYSPPRPDFHTDPGQTIHDRFSFDIKDYPSALINRHKFQDYIVSQTAFWRQNVGIVLQELAPVNLWMSVRCDLDTRKVIVDVEGYCTNDLTTTGKAFLSVAMTQSGIQYYQKGASDPDNYLHNHMLRAFLTPTWGDELTDCFKGNYFTRQYIYDLPEQIGDVQVEPLKLEFLAFVTTGETEVLNSTATAPTFEGINVPMNVTFSPYKIDMPSSYAFDFIEFNMTNKSADDITSAVFYMTLNGASTEIKWEGTIKPNATELIILPVDMTKAKIIDNIYSFTCIEINGEKVEFDGLSGTFDHYAQPSSPRILVSIKTDETPESNTFYIKDSQGEIIKEFGPYYGGTAIHEEVVMLDANQTYCFEVNDADGNGMNNPDGNVTIYDMARNTPKLLVNESKINGYGWRFFFDTSLPIIDDQLAGVEGIDDDSRLLSTEVYDLNGMKILTTDILEPNAGVLSTGIYILKRNYDSGSTVSKIVIR